MAGTEEIVLMGTSCGTYIAEGLVCHNTVLKIAKKRAHIDATLTVTGAADLFTQDLIDEDEPQRAPVKMPVETKDEPAQGNTHTVAGPIEAVSVKEGERGGKPWKKYGVKIGENWYTTFDDKVGVVAVKGATVTISYMTNAKGYHDIVSLQSAGQPTDTLEEQGDAHECELSIIEKIEIFWSEADLPIGKLLTLLRRDKLLGEFDDLGKLAENKQAEVLAKIGVYASRASK
jgi:hypothetical protein